MSTYTRYSKIESAFVQELFEHDLIVPKTKDNEVFIDENDIVIIERLFRLHRDLGINFEGLCTVNDMLARIQRLEAKMNQLQQRLNLYE